MKNDFLPKTYILKIIISFFFCLCLQNILVFSRKMLNGSLSNINRILPKSFKGGFIENMPVKTFPKQMVKNNNNMLRKKYIFKYL